MQGDINVSFLFAIFPCAVNCINLLTSNDVMKLTVMLDYHLFHFTSCEENGMVHLISMKCIDVFTAVFNEMLNF